jgi:hypothetical protein
MELTGCTLSVWVVVEVGTEQMAVALAVLHGVGLLQYQLVLSVAVAQ